MQGDHVITIHALHVFRFAVFVVVFQITDFGSTNFPIVTQISIMHSEVL